MRTTGGCGLSASQDPKIVRLNLLDTDYAKIAAGEAIPEDKKRRLAPDHYNFEKLGKQIARYRYADLDQQGLDDILCSIGVTADLFTLADLEDINERLRRTGQFYLTEGERQQVINWLQDELGVELV
ncbi:MAG: hypothetical protein ICV77_00770 [Cyanobacteria bacterium Co-bin8]|nr:hypothetical protein [Cyanobacteria bacterium Co-bin8]MBD2259190.1 hypothetical protein [Pseudanabaena sp. FACHB-2040]